MNNLRLESTYVTCQIYDPGYKTVITSLKEKKNIEAQFLINPMLKNKIKKII